MGRRRIFTIRRGKYLEARGDVVVPPSSPYKADAITPRRLPVRRVRYSRILSVPPQAVQAPTTFYRPGVIEAARVVRIRVRRGQVIGFSPKPPAPSPQVVEIQRRRQQVKRGRVLSFFPQVVAPQQTTVTQVLRPREVWLQTKRGRVSQVPFSTGVQTFFRGQILEPKRFPAKTKRGRLSQVPFSTGVQTYFRGQVVRSRRARAGIDRRKLLWVPNVPVAVPRVVTQSVREKLSRRGRVVWTPPFVAPQAPTQSLTQVLRKTATRFLLKRGRVTQPPPIVQAPQAAPWPGQVVRRLVLRVRPRRGRVTQTFPVVAPVVTNLPRVITSERTRYVLRRGRVTPVFGLKPFIPVVVRCNVVLPRKPRPKVLQAPIIRPRNTWQPGIIYGSRVPERLKRASFYGGYLFSPAPVVPDGPADVKVRTGAGLVITQPTPPIVVVTQRSATLTSTAQADAIQTTTGGKTVQGGKG